MLKKGDDCFKYSTWKHQTGAFILGEDYLRDSYYSSDKEICYFGYFVQGCLCHTHLFWVNLAFLCRGSHCSSKRKC